MSDQEEFDLLVSQFQSTNIASECWFCWCMLTILFYLVLCVWSTAAVAEDIRRCKADINAKSEQGVLVVAFHDAWWSSDMRPLDLRLDAVQYIEDRYEAARDMVRHRHKYVQPACVALDDVYLTLLGASGVAGAANARPRQPTCKSRTEYIQSNHTTVPAWSATVTARCHAGKNYVRVYRICPKS